MAVSIKSAREIELMRESGKILAKVHDELGKAITPGISTKEIDILGDNSKMKNYKSIEDQMVFSWIDMIDVKTRK